MTAHLDARCLLDEIESDGGRIELRRGGVQVVPAGLLTPDVVARLRVVGRELVTLLRERQAPPTSTVACELRRFPDWRPDMVVRFCAEPGHGHDVGVPTFDCIEIDLMLAWVVAAGVCRLDATTRDALLELKARFGGRIDAATIGAMATTPVSLRRGWATGGEGRVR